LTTTAQLLAIAVLAARQRALHELRQVLGEERLAHELDPQLVGAIDDRRVVRAGEDQDRQVGILLAQGLDHLEAGTVGQVDVDHRRREVEALVDQAEGILDGVGHHHVEVGPGAALQRPTQGGVVLADEQLRPAGLTRGPDGFRSTHDDHLCHRSQLLTIESGAARRSHTRQG
jgi:hypothetical protein